MRGVQVDLILGAVQPEADSTSAALPSRSSMNRVWIFWAMAVRLLLLAVSALVYAV